MTGETLLARAVADVEFTPAQHVHLVLREARRRGLEFHEAWTLAKKTMPRGSRGHDVDEDDEASSSAEQMAEWSQLLDATRDVWRQAYRRVVPPAMLAGGTVEALDLATEA